MSATATACVSDDVLVQLAAERVAPEEVEGLHQHLDECPACTAALLAAVRGAGTARAPVPAEQETRLGRFELRERLGSGAMGTVFAAWDPQLEREVAIKVLRAGRADVHDGARLMREARSMAQIRHANVVTVYEVGQDRDVIFVAMERVTGSTLRHAAAGAPRTQVVRWLAQVARGLAAVHAAGLTHRDVKPDNIFIEGDRAVLGDFGLATTAAELTDARDARAAVAAGTRSSGTPAYMAPEQLRGEPADVRVDVFAFGVTAWELLTGNRPYHGLTPTTLADAVAAGPPPPSGLPAALAGLLARCLDPERARRPPSMTAIIEALDGERTGRRGWRRLAAGAAALAAAAIAVALVALRPRASPVDGAVITCDSTVPSTWDDLGPGWRARAAGLAPVVRDRIVATMIERRDQWRGLAARACAGDVFARTAWLGCRRRLEADEREVLELAVSQRWTDDTALLQVVGRLDPPSMCMAKEAAEDALEQARLTDGQRGAVATGRALLTRARGAHALGFAVEVDRALAAAQERAATAAAPGFATEVELARLELRPPSAPRDEVAALRAVAAAAERHGSAALIARAWLLLASRAIALEIDEATVTTAMNQAEWAIDRLGAPPRLRGSWLLMAAEAAWNAGDRPGARRQLAAVSSLAGDDPFLAVLRRLAITNLVSLAGDDRAAAGLYQELIDDSALMAALPPSDRVRVFGLLAECQERLGQYDEAARAIATAIAEGRALDADDPLRVSNDAIAATIAYQRGDHDEALRSLERALATATRALGADHIMVGHIQLRLGNFRCQREQYPPCLAALREAIRVGDGRHGRRNELSVAARALLAEALAASGDRAGSLAAFAEAETDARAVYDDDPTMWAQYAPSYASALVAAGRRDEARAQLEAAVPVLLQADPARAAELKLELAELVVDLDPARARALATEALAAAAPSQRATITAWLRRHRG